ncbi:hypothetical protein ACGFH8_25480 [Micromonospora sp. NPDC049175]|uniref:hypothetical protein n=1 Tax=Micromonospora sp. NPDC049175 TaxID=3364266 RepID=UPI003722CFEE
MRETPPPPTTTPVTMALPVTMTLRIASRTKYAFTVQILEVLIGIGQRLEGTTKPAGRGHT